MLMVCMLMEFLCVRLWVYACVCVHVCVYVCVNCQNYNDNNNNEHDIVLELHLIYQNIVFT